MSVRLLLAAATLILLLTSLLKGNAAAATVKPLEVFSEKILVLEIEYFATEHTLNSALLRRSVDRLNREMNIMSKSTAGESLKLLTNVSEKLSASVKSSEALSRYLTTNSARLKDAGHGRYLPLAEMDKEIEGAYFKQLSTFLKTAFTFVQFCYDNFDGITSGKKEEGKRYEELYAAYLKDMELFNAQSIARSQLLAEMGSEYPSLWELMPR
jgi:hypothetical protein